MSTIVLLGVTACGFVFSPGDYTGSSGPVDPDASPSVDARASEPESPLSDDAGPDAPTPSGTRVLLVAGGRDTLPGEEWPATVSEAFHTLVNEAGELGPWTWDVPPPFSSRWRGAGIVGGVLWLSPRQDATETSVVWRVGFDGGVSGEWEELVVSGDRPPGRTFPLLTDAGLFVAGGGSSSEKTKTVARAAFTDVEPGPWAVVSESRLSVARDEVTLFRHASFLYAIGGRTSSSSGSSYSDVVEVATIGADGLPGPFVETTRLTVEDETGTTNRHVLSQPTIASGSGYLFVIGGWYAADNASISDVVLAAKVDETTGQLGEWKTLPRYPLPIGAAAAFVIRDTLYVFGGRTPPEVNTDAVYALPILPDGTFGSEWRRVGALPGPRGWLVGVVY